jgi:hypothetical protein
MGVLLRRKDLVRALALVSASIAVIGSGGLAASTAAASALPNPCSVLAAAHAQNTIARGHHVNVGKVKVSTSTPTYKACGQVVGSITVYLGISSFFGGSGGVAVTSRTHPSGLGAGDVLTIGKAMGAGGPVDVIDFHKGGVYVTISANGAAPSNLTALARQVFRSLH